ncbi:MAG: hypothetical protein ABS949_10760 [Solibacillus sp.]
MTNFKGAHERMNVLESIQELMILIIVISCVIYRRQLKLTKWKRKLSKGEMTMYIMTSIALPVYAILYFVFLLES